MSGTPRRLLLWAGAAAVLVGGGAAARLALRAPVEPPPEVDLAGVEPVIARKLEDYLDSVRARPRSAEAWGRLGMAYDVHGFKAPALTCYRQAVALAPGDFRWTYVLAFLLQKMGDVETGDWIARGLELRPDYGPLLLKYAELFFNTGQFDSAARYYRRVIEVDSGFAHGYHGLGRVAVARDDLEAAKRFLEQGRARNYRQGELRLQLAEVYRRLGDLEATERERIAATQLPQRIPYPDPVGGLIIREGVGSYWAKNRGATHLAQGNIGEAFAQYREALRHRDDWETRTTLGIALHRMGQFAQAAEQHRAALALEPTAADAHANLAETLFALGQTDEALRHVEEARRLDPASIKPEVALAGHYAQSDDWPRAFASMRAALRKQPDNFQTLGRLAWLYVNAPPPHRDGRQALPLARRAAELTVRREAEVLMILAEAHKLMGDLVRAREVADEAEQVAREAGDDARVQTIRRTVRGWER